MYATTSLEIFPTPPTNNKVSLCFVKRRQICGTLESNFNLYTLKQVKQLPIVFVIPEQMTRNRTIERPPDLFVQVQEIFLKRLIRVYREQGFREALTQASQLRNSSEPKIITVSAYVVLKTWDCFNHLIMFRPSVWFNKGHKIEDYTETRGWTTAPVRYLAWHPMCNMLALVTSDDSVRVFSVKKGSDVVTVFSISNPVLKGEQQKTVTCVSWRPHTALQLAVGCEKGAYLWRVVPDSIVRRPSITKQQLLKHPQVISMSWDHVGHFLATASLRDPKVFLWEPELNANCPLKCCLAGVSIVSWAPPLIWYNREALLTVGADRSYSVWNTRRLTSKKWYIRSGIIRTACWSPCGNFLYLANSEEPMVFAFNMKYAVGPASGLVDETGPLRLLDTCPLLTEDGTMVGGLIRRLRVSHEGRFMAIMFENSNLIALTRVHVSDLVVQIEPCCFIRGAPDEYPVTTDFQKESIVSCRGNLDPTCVLTIAWSTLRIQHYPIVGR